MRKDFSLGKIEGEVSKTLRQAPSGETIMDCVAASLLKEKQEKVKELLTKINTFDAESYSIEGIASLKEFKNEELSEKLNNLHYLDIKMLLDEQCPSRYSGFVCSSWYRDNSFDGKELDISDVNIHYACGLLMQYSEQGRSRLETIKFEDFDPTPSGGLPHTLRKFGNLRI